MAQLGAAPKVLTFLKSVQYIQRYHLLKYPLNPTLSALHCWEIVVVVVVSIYPSQDSFYVL